MSKSLQLAFIAAFTLMSGLGTLLRLTSLDLHKPAYANLAVFAVAFVLATWNRRYAVAYLSFLLPFVAGFDLQWQAWFQKVAPQNNMLFADLYSGLLLGFLLNAYYKSRSTPDSPQILASSYLPYLLIGLHLMLLLSTCLAIVHNLHQSASSFSVKGFFYNIGLQPILGYEHDYHPLRGFQNYNAVILCALWLLRDMQQKRDIWRYFIIPLSISASILFVYGILSKLYGIGFHSAIDKVGINSFFPDIHSYASFSSALLLASLAVVFRCQQYRFLSIGLLLLAGSNLVLSGSRSTILLCLLAMTLYVCYELVYSKERLSKTQKIGLTLIGPTLLAFAFSGISRLSLKLFAELARVSNFQDLDALLSMRPGLILATLRMIRAFPFSGLGLDNYVRNGAILEFSKSSFLHRQMGENAHNFFLQVFAELGLLGFLAYAAVVISFFVLNYRRSNHFNLALGAGIILGNIFAHSLLVTSILGIFFLGIGFSHAAPIPDPIPSPGVIGGILTNKLTRRFSLLALTVLVLAWAQEAYRSLGELPFNYGSLCHQQVHFNQEEWGGFYEQSLIKSHDSLEVKYAVKHADLGRRPVVLNFQLLYQDHAIFQEDEIMHGYGETVRRFDLIDIPNGSPFRLQMQVSRCYVPLNLGVSPDSRRLAFALTSLRQF